MKSKNKYRVNWIDGMKINKNHFIDLEDSLLFAIKNSEQKQITPINYGLLPDFSEQGSSIDVSISVDGQNTIEVILNMCKAITLGGYQINISEATKTIIGTIWVHIET